MTAILPVLTGRDEPPAGRSPARRRAAYLAGGAGWALLAAAALAALAAGPGGPGGSRTSATQAAVELVVGLALPLAAWRPALAWRAAWLGAGVTPLIPGANRVDTGLYAVLAITLVVAGLRSGPPRLWWLAGLSLVPVWLWTPGRPGAAAPPDWDYPADVTVGLALLTALLYAAWRARRDQAALAAQRAETRRQAAEAERQAAEAERQSRQRAALHERGIVLEERARIAREMHDVVAHHMSLIAVQAETAPYRLAALPDDARREFATLSQAARDALADMRRLLGVLRSETAPERLPQPGLADVPALVEAARRAGAEVALAMPGPGLPPAAAVPPVVALTAYRIVQESLSNAGRHAPGAPVRVEVGGDGARILVTVVNAAAREPVPGPPPRGRSRPGPGEDDGNSGGGGHGLTGMRERVALAGGHLRAGPHDGGYAVRAELPLARPRDQEDA